MEFICKGHKNVQSLHRSTLEFTHDLDLTLRGDCIVAVSANYSLDEIMKEKFSGKLLFTLSCEGVEDSFEAEYNSSFSDAHEMVIRTSDFVDARTFAIRSTKAAKHLSRELIAKLQNPNAILTVTIISQEL